MKKKIMVKVHIECDDCLASCSIHHELEESLYELTEVCPFCGSDDVIVVYDEEIK